MRPLFSTLALFALLLSGLPAGATEVGALAQDLGQRRAWALELDATDATDLDLVFERLGAEDRVLRGILIEYLGEIELSDGAQRDRCLRALGQRIRVEPDGGLRLSGLVAIARQGGEGAVAELLALLEWLDGTERRKVAQLLSGDLVTDTEAAKEAVVHLVQGAFAAEGRAMDSGMLRILLPAYGKLLAESSGGGATAKERAPLLLARQHPSAAVRRAAEVALDTAIRRLEQLERFEGSDRLLRRLSFDGLRPQLLRYLRSIEILEEGAVSPQVAFDLAQDLGQAGAQVNSFVGSSWPQRAALVQSNALIAMDRLGEARVSLQRARELNLGLLARRYDLQGKPGGLWQRDLWNVSAQVEFTDAFRLVAQGSAGDDLDVLEALRRAHILQLQAQLLSVELDLPYSGSLDLLFGASPSPYLCVFSTRPHPGWHADRILKVQGELGRGLATISWREMPGFEPYGNLPETLLDPIQDPQRAPLLEAIAQARVDAVQRNIDELQLRRLKQLDSDPALEGDLNMLYFTQRRMRQELRTTGLEDRFYELRRPSAHALLYAEALRREDRNQASRKVAERTLAAIDKEELRQQYTWGWQMAAQTKLVIGGSYSDQGEAKQAEKWLLEGLEFFEGLQSFYVERGLPMAAQSMDDDIAEALVSLAVNANVQGKDPAGAADYFERAYELRQDDFMRVLLACYRARSGDEQKARQLMAGVPDSPRGYYNMACTHALLGDMQEALEYLEMDFDANRTSVAALEKQKAWAREDPDLGSLRQDPRFLLLTQAALASDLDNSNKEDE